MSRPKRTQPWLAQRDNGVWYAHWYDASARRERRQSLDTTDDADALRKFCVWGIERSTGGPGDGCASGMTVAAALDVYFDGHVAHKVVDRPRQATAIAHLKAFFGNTKLKAVGIVESRAYAAARRSGAVGGGARRRSVDLRKASDATIRRELVVLVAAANHCLEWKKVAAGEMPTVELPAEPPADEVKWLTKEQLRAALDTADGKLRDFILIAYYTAARRKSIERLLKRQVDLKTGRINLQPEGRAQTKKRRPIVPLYAEIRPTIERLMNESETPFVFGEVRDFYRDFIRHMAGLGIEAWPHMLRHSRATHMLQDGEDPFKVAGLLGDTLTTVQKVYGHHSVEYLETKSSLVGGWRPQPESNRRLHRERVMS